MIDVIKSNSKAIIFDMDGLLIDSMLYWIESDSEFFGKRGIEVTEEMIKYFSGRSEIENMQWIKDNFNLKEEVDDLIKERIDSTDVIYTEKTNLMPGAKSLISTIKEKGINQAIASGSPHRHIDIARRRFEFDNYFNNIISVDDVGAIGKPDPAVYLYTAKCLGVNPKDCVVFEDAENGVVAAKSAGMKCIAIPDNRWSFGDFTKADLVCDSLENEEVFKFLGIQ